MKTLNTITLILLIIGGLNWGLVAIDPRYDIVANIGGSATSGFAKLIYALVGLSAIYQIFVMPRVARAETRPLRPVHV